MNIKLWPDLSSIELTYGNMLKGIVQRDLTVAKRNHLMLNRWYFMFKFKGNLLFQLLKTCFLRLKPKDVAY
jgi:hypothetical protein